MVPSSSPSFDRLHKVRPVLEMVRKNYIEEYRPSRNCSIDETMVGFKGRIGFKQYLPMKPTKRGYKIWVRADAANGYMCDFRVYTGKDGSRPMSGLDLGGEVVRQLSEDLAGENYIIFFDNFFPV